MSTVARILDGGPIEDVGRQGQVVVTGGPVPILLVADGDNFRACHALQADLKRSARQCGSKVYGKSCPCPEWR